jgi:hypothetical protein
MRNTYKILVGKSEGKRPLGCPRHKWEDNMRMEFRVISLEVMDWIDVVQERNRGQIPVNIIINFRAP